MKTQIEPDTITNGSFQSGSIQTSPRPIAPLLKIGATSEFLQSTRLQLASKLHHSITGSGFTQPPRLHPHIRYARFDSL